MRKYNDIVQSDNEPSLTSLWLNDGILRYFGDNGWTNVKSSLCIKISAETLDDLNNGIKVQIDDLAISSDYDIIELVKDEEHITFYRDRNIGENSEYYRYYISGGNLVVYTMVVTNGYLEITSRIYKFIPEGGTNGQVLKKSEEGYVWSNDNDTKYSAATKATLGLVKASNNIANIDTAAELSTVISSFNNLLSQLRTSGILI